MSTPTQTMVQNKGISFKKKKRQSRKGKISFRALFIPVFVLVLWQALGSVGILPAQLFSSPLLIVASFIELIHSGELTGHLQISLTRALLGFTLGGFFGTVIWGHCWHE